jgi:hypothetical protein
MASSSFRSLVFVLTGNTRISSGQGLLYTTIPSFVKLIFEQGYIHEQVHLPRRGRLVLARLGCQPSRVRWI